MAWSARKETPTVPVIISPGVIQTIIGGSQLADDSVTSSKILDATIQSQDIGSGQIDTPSIRDYAVTGPKIAVGAVTADKIAANVIGQAKIAPNSIGTSELQNNAVQTNNIADKSVTVAKLSFIPVGATITFTVPTLIYTDTSIENINTEISIPNALVPLGARGIIVSVEHYGDNSIPGPLPVASLFGPQPDNTRQVRAFYGQFNSGIIELYQKSPTRKTFVNVERQALLTTVNVYVTGYII